MFIPDNDNDQVKPSITIENMPKLLKPCEAAEIFRVTPLTVKRWIKRGHLESTKINSRGDNRIPRESVLRLAEKGFGA